jgi:protein TonB
LVDVPVAAHRIPDVQSKRRAPAYVWWLVGLALAIHVVLVGYALNRPPAPELKRKHEVAVTLVTPPKPAPPKVEPPKPQPKPQVKRQALPPIQTAVPDTPSVAEVSSEPPVQVAPAAPVAEPPAPEPVTAPFGGAGYLNNPPPEYPAIAARQGWQGTVLLRVRVLSSGRVDTLEVQKSSGRKLLDEAAVETVRAWSFTPAKRGSTPIDGWATVPIEFKLDA